MKRTQIIPWNRVLGPMHDTFSRFERELDSLFDDPFFKDGQTMMKHKRAFPKMNVSETDTCYVIAVALPGFDKKDIKLILEESKLTIESKLVKKEEETNENFLLREISSRSFCRTIPFPTLVKLDSAKSKFTNGILRVELTKAEEVKNDEVVLEVE